LFTSSEATPSLDLNITHKTAHMKGAAVAQAAYQMGYRLTIQDSNPCGQTSPLFNGYQGSFLGEKRLRSKVNHHLHSRCGQRKLPSVFYCKCNSVRFTATLAVEDERFKRLIHMRKKILKS